MQKNHDVFDLVKFLQKFPGAEGRKIPSPRPKKTKGKQKGAPRSTKKAKNAHFAKKMQKKRAKFNENISKNPKTRVKKAFFPPGNILTSKCF